MTLRPKILDWYIFKKFMLTFVIALVLIIGIVIVFDISEKIDKFVNNHAPLRAIIVDYYLNFIPFFINMYSAIRAEATMYGTIMRWKLTPPESMATISELAAMREVKKMTEMNTNIALYMLMKNGMKFM